MIKDFNIKAIVVGFIVGWALSLSGVIGVMTVLAIHTGLGSKVHGHYETSNHLLYLSESVPIRLTVIAIYGAGSFIGGVTTGLLVSSHRPRNAVALALVNMAIFAPFIPFVDNYPIWLTVISIMTTSAFFGLGGWIFELIKPSAGDKSLC